MAAAMKRLSDAAERSKTNDADQGADSVSAHSRHKAQETKMRTAQNESRKHFVDAAFCQSGGHETRTRNQFPGTSFPMRPLTIRLPSKVFQGNDLAIRCFSQKAKCTGNVQNRSFVPTPQLRLPQSNDKTDSSIGTSVGVGQ
jgi:hypothetical protein